MNRIYRTLWSAATQSWQAVPETAKTAGRKSKSSAGGVVASVALSFSLSGGVGAQSPPAINQLPTGGTVARGTATISQTATAQAAAMLVNQSSQRAVINWNTFNLGSAASINFVQPNAQSVTLNRVNDSNPSQIFGRITANGQVFLTNASGVYFSRSSSVDVGAITATTHSISDDNFMSGKYVFERNGATGKVINEGNITAALGGYVALLAPEVQNAGVVVARAGTVAMAAGELITLNIDGAGSLAGITTTPSAIASLVENKLAVLAPDGQIILSAVAMDKLQAGVVKNSGSLEANSLVNKGGKILLEGDDIVMDRNSRIEAKGRTGGGMVLVGGDWQGSGDVRQATKVTMEAGATIDASATDNGDGGKVVLWSDIHNASSVTQVNGSIYAKAAANGNGGQVETSGHQLKIGDSATVDTTGGQWLLDPYDFTVASSGGNITGTDLSSLLASNNITITASTTASTSDTATSKFGSTGTLGDIYINDNVTWGANGTLANGKTLTLVAANNVYVNALMNPWGNAKLTVTATSGNLLMGLRNAPASSDGGFYGSINFTTTQGGTTGRTGTGILTIGSQSYKLISSVGTATDIAGTTSLQGAGNTAYVAMATDIDASATSTWNLVSGTNYAGFKPLTSTGSTIFNGLGHVIKGLYINADSTVSKVGLYSIAPYTGILNVGIDSTSSINSQAVSTGSGTINNGTPLNAFTGAIAAVSSTNASFIISNSYSMASVNAVSGAVGGVLGDFLGGKASNLGSFGSVDVKVTDTTGTVVAGGLMGQSSQGSPSTISNSLSTANVTIAHQNGSGASQSLYAGGFVGYAAVRNYGNNQTTYTGNTATGTVTVTGVSAASVSTYQAFGAVAGGFAGYADGEGNQTAPQFLFKQNTATGSVSANKGIAGGFIGLANTIYSNYANINIDQTYATGNVTVSDANANNLVGGLIGAVSIFNGKVILTNNYSLGNATGNLGKAGSLIGGFIGTDNGVITIRYNYALGTASGATTNSNAFSITLGPGITATTTPNYYGATGASGADSNLSGLNTSATSWGQDPNINSGHPFLINNAPVSFTPTLSVKTSGTWGGLLATAANPVLYGSGVTGDTINLYDGNTSLGTVSVTGGNWAYQAGANIALGQHIYKATQTSTVSSTYVSKPSLVSTYYALPVLYVLANTGLSMTYGGSIPSIGYSLYTDAAATIASVGVSPLGSAVYTFNGASSPTNAGTYSLSYASGLTSPNYNFAAASVTQTFTVNKANLTLIAASKTYDGLATVTAAQITSINGVNNETFTATSGTANISGKNVAGSKTLTDISGLTLTGSNGGLASNYYLDSAHLPTGGANAVTIYQANLTLTAGTDSKTYDGTTSSAVAVVVTGKAASDTVVASQAFADKNVLGTLGSTLQIASGYTITDGNNADMSGNYNITTAPATGTISKATLTLAATSDSKTYDGTTNSTVGVTVTGKAAPDTVVATQAFADKNVLGTGNSILQIAPGYTIKDASNGDMSGNYVVNVSATAAGTISPATASIAATKTYDGLATLTAPQITISGVNGETLSYTGTALLQSANVRDNASNYVSGLTALADNGGVLAANYVLPSQTAASARNTVTISKASATVTAGSSTTTYSGVAQTISSFTATGLVNGETEAVLTGVTVSATGTNAGTYTSTASGTDGNYNLTFVNGALTINKANATVTAGSTTTTYTGLAQSVSGFTATGLVNGETTSVLTGVTTSGGTGTNAGTYASTASGTATNYNLTFVPGALTINKAHLTVTADNASKTYGAANPTLSATVSGFVNGETLGTSGVSGAGGASTTATALTGAGTAIITPSLGTLTASNYDFTNFVNGTLTINKANATVTASSGTATYTGLAQSVSGFTASGLVNGETAAVLTAVSTSGGIGTNAGTYTHTASGTDSNYNLTFVNGALTINKANATVTANSGSTTYNGAVQSISGFTATGLVNNETPAVLTGVSTGASGTNAGTYTHTASGTDGNYNLTFVDGTFTINKAPLSVSLSGQTKVYDGTTSATLANGSLTLTGFVSGEGATVSQTQASYNSANVVGATTVTASLAAGNYTASTGTLLSNYVLPTSATGTGSITPARLSASGTKTYDGLVSFDATGLTVSGVNGETFTATGSGTMSSKNVQTNQAMSSIAGLSLSGNNGALASNYFALATSDTQVSVTPLAVNLSAPAASKTYDSTTLYQVSTSDLSALSSQLVGNDRVTAADVVYANKDAGTGKRVSLNSVTISDDNGGNNYTVGKLDVNTGVISKAQLTVSVVSDARFVTQSDAAGYAGVVYNGFVGGETASVVTAGSITRNNANTDTGARQYTGVLQASGWQSNNYNISYVAGDYTIVGAHTLLVSVPTAATTYGTAATYTPTAKYLDSSNNTIVTLTPTMTGNVLSVSDNAGGSASFSISAANATLSSSGNVQAGGYNLQPTNVVKTGDNFQNLVMTGGLTVNPKVLSNNLGVQSISKVYDGSASISNFGLSFNQALAGVTTGDTVSLVGSGSFDDRHVGTNKTVNLSLGLRGTDAANYALTNSSLSTSVGEITQLASVTYTGATNGNWSDFSNWAGGAMPDRNNVAQVIVPTGKTVLYNSDQLGTIGSTLTVDGAVRFTSSNPFTLVNSVSGSGDLQQRGNGMLTISGTNTNFSGNLDIGSYQATLDNAQALGTGHVVSSGGQLSVTSGMTLSALQVDGAVTVDTAIKTTGNQVYNGALTFLSSGTAQAPNFVSDTGNVEFMSTVSAGSGSMTAQRSLAVSAPQGSVLFNDQVGRLVKNLDFSTYLTTGLLDTSPYALTVTAPTIKLFGDVTTFDSQTYDAAVRVGNNGQNGHTRLLVSVDPSITFKGTVDDADPTGKVNGLDVRAISLAAIAANSPVPTITFDSNVGSTAPLASLRLATGTQSTVNGAVVTDIKTDDASRRDAYYKGDIVLKGNLTVDTAPEMIAEQLLAPNGSPTLTWYSGTPDFRLRLPALGTSSVLPTNLQLVQWGQSSNGGVSNSGGSTSGANQNSDIAEAGRHWLMAHETHERAAQASANEAALKAANEPSARMVADVQVGNEANLTSITSANTTSRVQAQTIGTTSTGAFIQVREFAPQTLPAQQAFVYELPADTFVHSREKEYIKLSATLSNGANLPRWVKFSPKTRTFSGEAPKHIKSLDVKVIATDRQGNKAMTRVRLLFTNGSSSSPN